jgi:hypothetical protein
MKDKAEGWPMVGDGAIIYLPSNEPQSGGINNENQGETLKRHWETDLFAN